MEVLILTGACGVGKSTTSIKWAKLKKGAIIDCDFFTEWIYNSIFEKWELEEELFVANLTAKTAIEYIRAGMPVAIEKVWTPKGIKFLVDQLKAVDAIKSIKVAWLYCDRTENHKRDEMRVPENQMKKRVDIVNDELSRYQWPDYVHKIDTSNHEVEWSIKVIEGLDALVLK